MTRKEAKDYLPIIKAYSEGEVIQAKLIKSGKWIDIDDEEELTLSCPPSEYRIKPEPKYRPFKSQEECWLEMHKHPDFGWLKNKDTGNYISIGEISKSRNGDPLITWATNEDYSFSISEVFSDYTFTDGTPFGVKEE